MAARREAIAVVIAAAIEATGVLIAVEAALVVRAALVAVEAAGAAAPVVLVVRVAAGASAAAAVAREEVHPKMLMPKKVKHRKMHRGSRAGQAKGGTELSFGEFGLQATESCWMTSNQIEAARIAMTRHIKRGGQIWIRIFPDKSVSKKPAETRMGSGKGAPEVWVAVVKRGRMLFEMAGVSEELAKEAMRLASHKLPIATKFVTKKDLGETHESGAA